MSDSRDDGDRRIAVTARDWVEHILAHEASAEDEAAMLAWRDQSPQHARALGEAVRLRGRLLDVRDALRSDSDVAAMVAAAREPAQAVPSPHRIGRRAFLGGAVAASAAGIMLAYPPVGLWPSLAELRADYRTGTGERRTVRVAQGLEVELNTRTALARRDDAMASRLKLISGEVAVDARQLALPAVIESVRGEASTRNGRFNARLREEGLCVTCFAGEVTVKGSAQPSLDIVQGQQILVGGGSRAVILTVDPHIVDAWRRGELIFNDRPLAEVVAEINRYRAGHIILTNPELAARTVNAVFRLDGLESAPSQIQIVSRAKVTDLPGGIVLLS